MSEVTVVFPHHDKQRWAMIEAHLLTPRFESMTQFNEALKVMHPTRSLPFFNTYLTSEADSYEKNGGINQKEFVDEILPYIQRLVSRSPDIFQSGLKVLCRGENGRVGMTQEQACCIVCMGMLQLFPGEFGRRAGGRPSVNFGALVSTTRSSEPQLVMMICILNYILQLARNSPSPGRNIYVTRRFIRSAVHDQAWWSENSLPLGKVSLKDGRIEDDTEALFHADFANEYLGGGVMNAALAQEEILFAMKPECLAAMAVVEVMRPNDAIIITGAARYSDYTGYAHSLAFKGTYEDKTPMLEELNCLRTHIVAIDSVVNYGGSQYLPEMVLRDLNKALAGLWQWQQIEDKDVSTSDNDSRPIYSTGHWGCGAFRGDKQLKAIQQWISASAAGLDLHYYHFGDNTFLANFTELIGKFESRGSDISVGTLAAWLFEAAELSPGKIFLYLTNKLESLSIGTVNN